MKKRERKAEKIILLILSSMFFISLVSAVNIQLAKPEYYPGETIQADITGSFSGGLSKDKIFLCRGSEVNPIAVSSNLVQLQDKFLFYALTSSSLSAGDYSIKIKSTTTQTCLSGVVLSKSFKITSTTSPYIQLDPGFIIYSSNGEISIKVKGFVDIQDITASFAATGETKDFTLVDLATKTIYFNTNNLYGNIESSVTINDYTIPVYLSLPLAPENQTQNDTINQTTEEEIILKDEIKFSPESMNLVVLNNTSYEVNFSVINLGNKTITGIDLSSESGEISLSKSYIDELSSHNTTKITIDFKTSEQLETNITLAYKNQSIYLPILINITKDQSEVDVETDILDINPTNFDLYINFSKKYKFNFTIENNGNKTIEDITISCEDENIDLDKTSISSIKPGKNTTVYFDVNTNETIDSRIEINYENETIILPLLFKEFKEEEYDLSEIIIFYPEEMNGTFLLDKEYKIILANVGEMDLEDITISCEDKDIEFTPSKIELLKSYKKTYVNITINSEKDINTFLTVEWNGQSISLPINGIITENESEEQVYSEDYQQYPTCIENGGVTCKKGEKCNGELDTDILLSNCCYGKCEAESSSTKWIIGLILLVVLGIGGFYFYSKYKNSKSSSSDEIMKNRSKDFEARMNPKEVHGNLSKI